MVSSTQFLKAILSEREVAVNAGDTLLRRDQVLFVNNGEAKVGEPTVAGATVTAEGCRRRQR